MPSARHSSKNILFLLIAVAVLLKPATAQEVQIMVSGPWAYVPGPTPTLPLPNPTPTPAIVIAAPQIPHHGDVQIFPGEDADDFGSVGSNVGIVIKQNKPGKYTLVISGLTDCDPAPSAPTPAPHAFPLTNVGIDQVVLGNINGFSILLPKPCFYTSYLESQSKLDLTSTANVDPKGYTTWMVLHYKAAGGVTPTASIQEIANKSATFQNNDGSNPMAISIVMGADSPNETNTRCDSLSGQSVQLEATLFGTTLHYQFPSIRKSGQQTAEYEPDCADNFASLTQAELKNVLSDIKTIELFLKNPALDRAEAQASFTRLNTLIPPRLHPPANVLNELQKVQSRLFSTNAATRVSLIQTKAYVIPMTAGAGDCRGAQLNVDGTIP